MAESQRPSRQDLVVPPQGSSLPMVLGALVCAAAGFGLVWSLGIGRSSGGFTLPFATHATMPDGSLPTAVIDAADPAAPLAADAVPRTFADDPMPGAPRRFPAIDDAGATPAAGQRGWPASPAAAAPPSADERYPTRPAALEVPDDVKPLDPGQPVAAPANASSRLAPRTSSPVRRTSFAATEEDRFSRVSSPIPAAFDADAAGGQPLAADDATAEPDAAVAGGLDAGGPAAGEPADDPAPLAADAAPPPTRSRFARMAEAAPAAADPTPTAPPAAADPTTDAAANDAPLNEEPATGDPANAAPLPADQPAAESTRARAPAADAGTGPATGPAAGIAPGVAAPPPADAVAARAAVPPSPAVRGPTSADILPPATAPPQAFPRPAAAPAPLPATGMAAAGLPAVAPAASPTSSPVIAAGSAGASAFAGAPPMGPPPAPRAAAPRGGDAGPAAGAAAGFPAGAVSTGQGRPGAPQLEGTQTPQLIVEKRGPREIQVGKPARYEILVRNVGKAIAQDVTLRDTVPYGTTLVATTPPASPAGGPAELVWPLGPLPPGGETRVSMEVMPQIEGDIGSVASVSFRAEASLRSRATKPDLRLELSETKPVRIGGDMPLSLKVSNPGTGVATGVVLEGILPEGVSHRAGRELEFDIGQLRPGESRSIDLVLSTTGPGVHQARFTVRADGRLEVEQAARIEITAPTLELKAEMPSRRYLQRPATCVLTMVNAGTAAARSVELAAQLPAGLKFVRANHAGWYDERTHRVLWNLEELPPGEVGAVEFVVMPVDLGPQKIVAAARSTDGPSDQAAHTVEVEGLAALFFEVTDSEDPIEVGGLTEYIVRLRNQGTKAAGGVRLTATMLGDMEPVDAKGPSAHHVENLSFVFDPLARLSPAEEAVYRIRVRGRRAGDQRVQVQVVSDDHPAPTTKEEVTRVYADQ